jgi:hypothetical protein
VPDGRQPLPISPTQEWIERLTTNTLRVDPTKQTVRFGLNLKL